MTGNNAFDGDALRELIQHCHDITNSDPPRDRSAAEGELDTFSTRTDSDLWKLGDIPILLTCDGNKVRDILFYTTDLPLDLDFDDQLFKNDTLVRQVELITSMFGPPHDLQFLPFPEMVWRFSNGGGIIMTDVRNLRIEVVSPWGMITHDAASHAELVR